MTIKTIFLIFGIGLACSLLMGLGAAFLLDPFLVEIRLSGADVRAGGEEGEQPVGEEASLTPLQIPGDLRV